MYLSDLLLVLREQLLCRVLGETALDHFFDAQCLDTEQVEDHIVCETELRLELRGRSEDHVV